MKTRVCLVLALVLLAACSLTAANSVEPLRTLAGSFNCVAFSPDGKLLASGSSDGSVKLWDVATGTLDRTLAGHPEVVSPIAFPSSVLSVAFSPDGKLLASGAIDTTVKLWNVATGAEVRTLAGHTGKVSSVAFSPDGKLLAAGSLSWDTTVKLWNVTTGALVRTLAGHTDGVSSVAFSPDGKLLASGSVDQTIKLWDVATGRVVRTLTGPAAVVSIAFSPNGKLIASGLWNNMVKLWDVAAGTEVRTLIGHTKYVEQVAFSPNGKLLASGSDDKTVKLWDVATGVDLSTLVGHAKAVCSVAFSPDGKLLASGSYDFTAKLWDVSAAIAPYLRSLLRAQPLLPFRSDFRRVIVNGHQYSLHEVTQPYYQYLTSIGVPLDPAGFRDGIYVLVVDPEESLPVSDCPVLELTLSSYFDARLLLVANVDRWTAQSSDIFWLVEVKHSIQKGIAGLAQAIASVAGGLAAIVLTGGGGTPVAVGTVTAELAKASLGSALDVLVEFSPVDALRKITFSCLQEAKSAFESGVALHNRLLQTDVIDAAEIATTSALVRAWDSVYPALVELDNEIWAPFASEVAGKCVWNATLSLAISGAGKVKAISKTEIARAVKNLSEPEKFALEYLLTNGLQVGSDLSKLAEVYRGASEALAKMGLQCPPALNTFVTEGAILSEVAFWAPGLLTQFPHLSSLLSSFRSTIGGISEHIATLMKMKPCQVALSISNALSGQTCPP